MATSSISIDPISAIIGSVTGAAATIWSSINAKKVAEINFKTQLETTNTLKAAGEVEAYKIAVAALNARQAELNAATVTEAESAKTRRVIYVVVALFLVFLIYIIVNRKQ